MNCAANDKRTLRTAGAEDIERLCEIAVAAWQPIFENRRNLVGPDIFEALWKDWSESKAGQLREAFESNPENFWVAEIDGRIAGFITFSVDRGRKLGTISNNAVAPEMQGRGLATWMYRRVLDEFRRQGLRYATVRTGLDEAHAPARRAYEKAGFSRSLPSLDYYLEI
jgi:ribosomal protein S18 acetylase RimI-like enzyme